ncbi:MAG: Fe-S cluster protein [Desulfobacterium sp.]|nr:Fe-S cluster protein [Desulfobacterium sp.]
MLLENYTMEIFKSKCQPGALGVHCFAHLEQDVSEALPYLNSVLGGFEYFTDPPAVTFKAHGKLITVHGKKIAVNALKDEEEAAKIVQWLKNEINQAWEERDTIEPCYTGMPRPGIVEILKRLPKTNCRECREPTCLVFATRIAEGARGIDDCSQLKEEANTELSNYLARFNLDI